MSKMVIILGAGASHGAGAPLMMNFLDEAESLLARGQVDDLREEFDLVFEGIHRLQAVHHKSHIDTENLESVFVAFEAAEMLRRLPRLDKKHPHRYSHALRRVI